MPKGFEKDDPHFKAEVKKYGRAIPSRDYLRTWLRQHKKAVTLQSVIEAMDIQDADLQVAISRRLNAMVRDAQICQSPEGYLSEDHLVQVTGTLTITKAGELAVLPDEDDALVYMPSEDLPWLVEGDRVMAIINRYGTERDYAVFHKCVKYNPIEIVGRMVMPENGPGVVISYDRYLKGDIVLLRGSKRAKEGQVVQLQIDRKESIKREQWCGVIHHILGDRGQVGIEIEMAIAAHQIPYEWPKAVTQAAEKWSENIPKSAIKDRLDLRELPLVTIDGEDAKDFDDAVYCEAKPQGGWRLIVAIADVSHYVKPRTPLDKEALHRGNSVYFPGFVIPMLPEVLSNGLCSLKPEVDRLCMACEMHISETGVLKRYTFHNAVMNSHARLTYNEVANLLDGNKRLRLRLGPLVPHIEALNDLYRTLARAREARGAIAFETVETQFMYDEAGEVAQIVPRQRNDAHKIIEECMLCANVATARFLHKSKMPALYRVHEGPTDEKLSDLRAYLTSMGLSLGSREDPSPKDYNRLLKEIEMRPDFKSIQLMMLRSLSQAIYSPHNKGHFGLSFTHYAHFTSPIRRYPDLLVHRALKLLIKDAKSKPALATAALEEMGEHCSLTERIADDATREATQALKCRFMADRVGEVFQGTVSSVAAFGLFIELKDIYIEGLVHVTRLGQDYFIYDGARQRMVGERTRKIFQLGDTLTVRVSQVNLDSHKIDLEIVREDNEAQPKSPKKAQKRSRSKVHKPKYSKKKKSSGKKR